LDRFFEVFALRVVFGFTNFFFTAVGFLLGFLARVLAAPFLLDAGPVAVAARTLGLPAAGAGTG
jgi:hypothetical protein